MEHKLRNAISIILIFSSVLILGQSKELDSLKALSHISDQHKITWAIALADHFEKNGAVSVDSIQYYAQLGFDIAKRSVPNSRQHVEAEYLLGRAESHAKHYSLAIKKMESVLEKSEKIDYPVGLRKGHYGLANIYRKQEENLKGIFHYEKAYEIALQYKEPANILLDLMVELCLEYIKVDDYTKTFEILEKSVVSIDHPSVSAQTKCLFYLNAALFNFDLKNHEKSLEQFNTALEIAENMQNNRLQMAALINIGNIHADNQAFPADREKSTSYYQRALKIIKKDTTLAAHEGSVLYYLGLNYYYKKAYEKTIPALEKSTEFLKNQDLSFYSEALAYLGYAYKKNHQYRKANIAFKNASKQFSTFIAESKKSGNQKQGISRSYLRLAEIDSAQGNFKQSLANYKLYMAYKDSIAKETNIKITERLDFARKTAEKDKEIAQLTNKNNIQDLEARQQKLTGVALLTGLILVLILLAVVYNRFMIKRKALSIIKEKNKENKLLMREIHHRVKNNLQIILSLLSAQKESYSNNQELKVALTESQNKIRSMSIIHQNLYKDSNFTRVSVSSYLQELIENLKESFTKNKQDINFELNIDTTEIKMGLAVPLGLILNELITNCYKYAFMDQNEGDNKIVIDFKTLKDPGKFHLLFKDNGIGLPQDFQLGNSPSFGIQLIYGLVEQLNGKIEIDTEEGTSFAIYLEEPVAA